MNLDGYLKERNESKMSFSVRSGVRLRTVYRVCSDGWCGTRNALLIVRAAHSEPTPTGGVVTLADLARPAREEAA